MKSKFEFVGYKLDRVTYKLEPLLDLISLRDANGNWRMSTSFLKPQYFKSSETYVIGMVIELFMQMNIAPSGSTESQLKDVVQMEIGIVGTFKFQEPPDEKERSIFVKEIAPSILFPYLRSSVTTILSQAGIPNVILPLLNIAGMVKDAQIEIEEKD